MCRHRVNALLTCPSSTSSILLVFSFVFTARPVIDKKVTTVVEQNRAIECNVKKANPAALITWNMQRYCHFPTTECWPKNSLWKDIDQKRFKIEATRHGSRLIVPKTEKADYFFRCKAQNSAGTDVHNVRFFYYRGGKSPCWTPLPKLLLREKDFARSRFTSKISEIISIYHFNPFSQLMVSVVRTDRLRLHGTCWNRSVWK